MADEINVATEMLSKRAIKMRVYNEALNQMSRLEIDEAALKIRHEQEPRDKELADDYEKTAKRLKTWKIIVEVAQKQIMAEKEELKN